MDLFQMDGENWQKLADWHRELPGRVEVRGMNCPRARGFCFAAPIEPSGRFWCGMWMRGLVWLGPAGLGLRAGGFDATMALGGGLMPIACESHHAAACAALESARSRSD